MTSLVSTFPEGATFRATDLAKIPRTARILESELRKRIAGQDHVIPPLVKVWQKVAFGVTAPNHTVANILFLGPTGVGKTAMVEAMAEAITGNHKRFLKVDCAEFQHSHEIAKLTGSPPGYVGHRETPAVLTQENVDRHITKDVQAGIMLFDEIEKGNRGLDNLLLGILDKGTVTLGDNRQVDLTKQLIFMTSNVGAAEMKSVLTPGIGFRPSTIASDYARQAARLTEVARKALEKRFDPEFLNRFDHVLTFLPLQPDAVGKIFDLEAKRIEKRFFNAGSLVFSGDVKDALVKEGYSPLYGARHLKRVLETKVAENLTMLMSTRQIEKDDLVFVRHHGGALDFSVLVPQAPVVLKSSGTALAMPNPPVEGIPHATP